MSASDFEERVVTVPLRDVRAVPVHERSGKAMSIIREHLAKHFKVEEADVRLSPAINEQVWKRGRRSPPKNVRVRAARFDEEGERVVEAEYAEQ